MPELHPVVDILSGCIAFIFLLMGLLVHVWKEDRRKIDQKADKEEVKSDLALIREDVKGMWGEIRNLNSWLREKK